MNGKNAKLLRKLSDPDSSEFELKYALNKQIWNAHPRPQRGALRQRALAMIEERPILGPQLT